MLVPGQPGRRGGCDRGQPETVSRGGNRRTPGGRTRHDGLTEDVRERGFRSNHAAATLAARGPEKASIGCVIGHGGRPVLSRLTDGVEQVARERGHFA